MIVLPVAFTSEKFSLEGVNLSCSIDILENNFKPSLFILMSFIAFILVPFSLIITMNLVAFVWVTFLREWSRHANSQQNYELKSISMVNVNPKIIYSCNARLNLLRRSNGPKYRRNLGFEKRTMKKLLYLIFLIVVTWQVNNYIKKIF